MGYLVLTCYAGWRFVTSDEQLPGENTVPDPLHPQYTHLRDIYFSNDPNYTGRFTVPVLFDKKTGRIVSNEVRALPSPSPRTYSNKNLRAPKSSACSTTNLTISSPNNTSASTFSPKPSATKSTPQTNGSTTMSTTASTNPASPPRKKPTRKP